MSEPDTVAFGGLRLQVAGTVIRPRPWTVVQSVWAEELARALPPGPLLELCAGCGAIGLEAARRTGRAVVLVDSSAEACAWARRNAAANGLEARTEVRSAPFDEALGPDERFPLILADPPYVPTAEVTHHPEDPVHAIDGGDDGLRLLRGLLAVLPRHLDPGGAALVQVRGPAQADAVTDLLATGGCRLGTADRSRSGHDAPPLQVVGVRAHDDQRAVLALRSSAARTG